MRIGIGEPAGQHTDNNVGGAVEADLLAENGGVSTEAPLKEAPREQNDVIASRFVFFGSKCAS